MQHKHQRNETVGHMGDTSPVMSFRGEAPAGVVSRNTTGQALMCHLMLKPQEQSKQSKSRKTKSTVFISLLVCLFSLFHFLVSQLPSSLGVGHLPLAFAGHIFLFKTFILSK